MVALDVGVVAAELVVEEEAVVVVGLLAIGVEDVDDDGEAKWDSVGVIMVVIVVGLVFVNDDNSDEDSDDLIDVIDDDVVVFVDD